MSERYPAEQRERAVRLVLDHLDEYPSAFAACEGIVRSSVSRCCAPRPARP